MAVENENKTQKRLVPQKYRIAKHLIIACCKTFSASFVDRNATTVLLHRDFKREAASEQV